MLSKTKKITSKRVLTKNKQKIITTADKCMRLELTTHLRGDDEIVDR